MTESVHRLRPKIILLVLVGIVIFSIPLFLQKMTACPLRLDGKCMYFELANTPEKRTKGLSDRESLPRDAAMLFDFENAGRQCIWMKDMKFPLDIVWVNNSKTITHIKNYVKPETYPETFCPSNDAKYVIELNAGIVDEAKLFVGKHLNL